MIQRKKLILLRIKEDSFATVSLKTFAKLRNKKNKNA